MKRMLILCLLLSTSMFAVAAEISVDGMTIKSGSTTIKFGDQNKRGDYWDGKYWRDPVYWDKHHGKGKNKHHCPPGQAKKGNC